MREDCVRWTCDRCVTAVTTFGRQNPKGWRWGHDGQIRHYCPECSKITSNVHELGSSGIRKKGSNP